jgi:hypothetical protein
MNIFSTKQKQLEMLQKQMESLQQEITQFHEEHPEYRKTLDAIEKERIKLIELVEKVYDVTIPNFAEIRCVWAGVEEYPEIVSCSYLLESNLSNFLVGALTENLFEIFDSSIQQIKDFSGVLDDIDQKVSKFNAKVDKAYEKFNEDFLLELKIQVG